jgi:hypothetical protein
MSTETASQFTSLRKELGQAVQEFLKKSDENIETNRNNESEQVKSLAEIRNSLSRLYVLADSMSRENRILRRLYFKSMYSREDTIANAESGTFAWILENGDDESSHSVRAMSHSSEDVASESESSIHREEEVNHEPEGTNVGPADSGQENDESSHEEDGLSHKSLESSHGQERRAGSENKESIHRDEDETSNHNDHSSDRLATVDISDDDDAASVAYPRDREEISQSEKEVREFTRDAFLTWLKSGSQIYHISGKAGSGKSTLMKFLSQHSRVREELESWADGRKLVLASFFFWNSGDKLQMSLEGLYRALLFETLKQYPELIPEIFPDQWNSPRSEETGLETTTFRFHELKVAFKNLIGQRAFEKHRICLFIDGLDEYEGDSVEHWKLAENLQSWASSEDIKICVSSRPHTEFLNTFSNDPKLRIHLHELTRGDISRFAHAMFEQDRNFDRIKDTYLDLVHDIVEMANGVFLWARLVVRSLLSGVGHRDSALALQQKLNAVPRGLDELFDKLLGAIDPADRKRSDKLLLIATLNHRRVSLNALAFSWLEDLEDPNFPFNSPVQGYSDEEIKKRHHDLPPQLDSLSKGLLEISHASESSEDLYFARTVNFFHRTVREYLQEDLRQSQMKSRVPGFDTNKALCRLFLAEFKFARPSKASLDEWSRLFSDFVYTMFWLDDMTATGNEMPANFVEEFGRVIDTYKQLPYSIPETNDGRVVWGRQMDILSGYIMSSGDDVSYLHWAAYYQQRQYIRQKVSQDPTLIKGANGLSLLVTAAFDSDHELTAFLLQAGASPNELTEIRVKGGTNLEGEKTVTTVTTATTWMIFLLFFAAKILKKHSNFESASLVLEQFLKFGVDSDVFFLVHHTNSVPTDDQLLLISLQQLIRLSQPSNLESIQTLLLTGTKRPFWSTPTSLISRLTPWLRSSNSITSKYKPFEFKELGEEQYKLHSVCCKNSQLRNNCYVRVY